ncbi:MAG: NAD(P)/FAD-dependent oxidoreductase [Actinomycetota bacterium]|nr:NAD(P)/FAD-dependent oxidoreductase [Actinomycetota bacterium]
MRIVIVGAGPSGICAGVRLLEAGLDDFVLVEKGPGVGGTWRHNTYPGAACDIQSALYSFSFAPKVDWSRPYGTQPEILRYMEEVADRFGLLPRCRFGVEVVGASWDEARSSWTTRLSTGETLESDVLVSAIGMFNELAYPDIPGLDSFAGTRFHSARWDWDHDLTGERVAVIGSAASAVQFVPEIVEQAGPVHLYQRTANWVLPKPDTPYTEEQLEAFRSDPALMAALRQEVYDRAERTVTFSDPEMVATNQAIARAAIDVVEDPETRTKLIPDHPWGCKRPLLSNNFYPAFNRPNLELVTEPIDHVDAGGVVSTDGRRRPVDTLILATGFQATRYTSALDVTGRGGRRLDDAWRDGAAAYLGVTTAGFPNLFMLYGPNTNNGSILTMIEAQVDHLMSHLGRLRADGYAWVDVRPAVMERYNDEIQAAIAGVTVWNAGCNGYYRTSSGRVVTQWPHTMSEFERRARSIDWDSFEYPTAAAG